MINSGKSVGQGPALPTELPKRKRGRPRKQPQDPAGPLPPKKPRGRPKGSKKLNTGSGQMVHTMAEKKPRGRPRKWLIVQEDAYQKAGTEGRINPSSATACPTTEGTSSGKGCPRTKRVIESKRPLTTSPAMAQQEPAC
ncbi:uncharacterized protein LOC144586749 isoform X3 [Pogona vitticeps]